MTKQIKREKIWEDFSNYESGKESDGGRYGFWTIRKWYENEYGERFYIDFQKTTACLSFCEICGSFQNTRVVPIMDDEGDIVDYVEACDRHLKGDESINYRRLAVFE